jgi:hypothetical protein
MLLKLDLPPFFNRFGSLRIRPDVVDYNRNAKNAAAKNGKNSGNTSGFAKSVRTKNEARLDSPAVHRLANARGAN